MEEESVPEVSDKIEEASDEERESAGVAVAEKVEEIVDDALILDELTNYNAMVEAEIDALEEIIDSGSSDETEQEILVNDLETEGEVSFD